MSRIAAMLNAKDRLPPRLRTLFDLLFVQGMTEEQVCSHLQLDQEALRRDKSSLLRSLKAAAT